MSVEEVPDFEQELPADPLPPDLAAAVEQVRARNPTPEMIEQLISRASRLGTDAAVTPRHRRTRFVQISAGATVAAALVLMAGWFFPQPRLPVVDPVPPVVVAAATPSYSAVTKRSLVDAGFKQIEADLLRAEEQIAAAADELVLAEVRWDLGMTLAQYRHWGE